MIPSLEIKWIFKENFNNKIPESKKLERNIEKLKIKMEANSDHSVGFILSVEHLQGDA